jgi:hypothetical protein
MATTIVRLMEEIGRVIYGGNIPVSGKVTPEEIKVAIGQVFNSLLKVDYLQINGRMGETIPNGSVLGLYENIPVTKYKNKAACTLPIKPIKLPRNMGVWSIFDPTWPDREYIPLQMGQWGLVQSQPMINDLLGQCGYECFGMQVLFTKDITDPTGAKATLVNMRLVIMDISQYGDFDPLPVLPEMEWQIKMEVLKLLGAEVVSDKIVDPGHKEQNGVPIPAQAQT